MNTLRNVRNDLIACEDELFVEVIKILIYYGVSAEDLENCAHDLMDLVME